MIACWTDANFNICTLNSFIIDFMKNELLMKCYSSTLLVWMSYCGKNMVIRREEVAPVLLQQPPLTPDLKNTTKFVCWCRSCPKKLSQARRCEWIPGMLAVSMHAAVQRYIYAATPEDIKTQRVFIDSLQRRRLQGSVRPTLFFFFVAALLLMSFSFSSCVGRRNR